MHIKKTLDNELIANDINFLFSCYITDLVSDETGELAGCLLWISSKNKMNSALTAFIVHYIIYRRHVGHRRELKEKNFYRLL